MEGVGGRALSCFVLAMYEMASGTVGAVPLRVKGLAILGLILWMTRQRAQLMSTMGKLALIAIATESILLEGTTHLGLVSVDPLV